MPGTMFGMCSVGFFSRSGVAHCFLCDLLSFCYVSVSVTFWYVLSVLFVTFVFCMCYVLCFVMLVPPALFCIFCC